MVTARKTLALAAAALCFVAQAADAAVINTSVRLLCVLLCRLEGGTR